MSETWLRNNSRALWFSIVLPGVLLVFGILLAAGIGAPPLAVRLFGGLLAACGLLALVTLAVQLRQPRLVYRDGFLYVRLRPGSPIRVPIEIVEGFLLGQGPSQLPGRRYRNSETRTLVIRLAESAEEWAKVEGIPPLLGKWCGGYITIQGTWCEPLDVPLVNRLNARLAEVHAELHPTRAMP